MNELGTVASNIIPRVLNLYPEFSSSTPIQITDNNSDNAIHGQKSADQD